jgi:hypothetical protein
MIPAMAILMLEKSRPMVCLGCSGILAEKHLLEVVEEFPLNGHELDYSVVVYRIKPGFTLEDCRAVIKGRHIGPAWGS